MHSLRQFHRKAERRGETLDRNQAGLPTAGNVQPCSSCQGCTFPAVGRKRATLAGGTGPSELGAPLTPARPFKSQNTLGAASGITWLYTPLCPAEADFRPRSTPFRLRTSDTLTSPHTPALPGSLVLQSPGLHWHSGRLITRHAHGVCSRWCLHPNPAPMALDRPALFPKEQKTHWDLHI